MSTNQLPRFAAATATAALFGILLSGCSSAAESAVSTPEPTSAGYEVHEDLRALLPEDIISAGVIKVGTPYSLPPSISVGDSGEPVGITPDLAAAFSQILGVDFVWSDVAQPIPALQAGTLDLSMGALGDTAERQKVLDFVDQMQNKSAILVAKGNPDNVTDIESLCGLPVAVISGSQQEIRARAISDSSCGGSPIDVRPFQTAADGTAQVQSGAVAGLIAPGLIVLHTAETAGDGSVFEVTSARYADNPFAMAMAKDRGSLSEAILGALKVTYDDGTYAAIMAEYGASDIALEPDQVVINGGGTSAFPVD